MEILRKNPGFAAVSLLLLTLGFGVLSAALILAKAVFSDDLPFKDPSRLVMLKGIRTEKGEVQDWAISGIDFADWRQRNRSFEQMAVFSPEMPFNFIAGREAERLSGEIASHGYFSLLGAEPAVGRFFTPEEDGKPFTHPVAVLSYDVWQRRFGGDPKVVDRRLDLNGQPYKVVGVASEGFRGLSDKADAWIPSSMPPGPVYVSNRRMRWLMGVAVLKPGVTIEQAQADLDGITRALEKEHPESNVGMGVQVAPFADFWFGELYGGLRLFLLGALGVALLACVNVGGLLRARAPAGQAVAAGVLLAGAGAALGLALGSWATRSLVPESGFPFPTFLHLGAGPGVIAAVLALAVACGALLGLLAARGPGRPAASGPLVQGLAVAQVALAFALAVAAGLMAKGYLQVTREELGFRREGILTLRVDLQGPKYASDPTVIELVHAYLGRMSKLPGVAELAIAGPTVPTDAWAGGYITIEDHDSDLPGGLYPIMTHSVSPGYFAMLDIPVLAGRAFTPQDAGVPGKPFNVLVSQAMAAEQWPGQSPLGKRLKFSKRENPAHPWLTVVGVVGDVRHEGLMAAERPAPDLYLPIFASPIRLPMTLNFLAVPEEGVSTAALLPALEREIRALTPDSPPYDPATLEERLDKQTREGRSKVLLMAVFAALALGLAAAGVYAAVGAGGVRRGALLAGAGVALGLAAVFGLGRRLADLLYGGSATDPLVLAGTAVLVLLLMLAASSLGSRSSRFPVPSDT